MLRFVIRIHSMKERIIPMARHVPCLFLEQGSLLSVHQGVMSSAAAISYSSGPFCSKAVGGHLQSSYSSCSRLLYCCHPPSWLQTSLALCAGWGCHTDGDCKIKPVSFEPHGSHGWWHWALLWERRVDVRALPACRMSELCILSMGMWSSLPVVFSSHYRKLIEKWLKIPVQHQKEINQTTKQEHGGF